jgi:hypothetical protein
MIPTIQSILDPSKGRIDFLRENTQDSWHQWKIEKSRVFERCLKKFSTRLNQNRSNNGDWNAVKKTQKKQLKQEQENNH